MHQDRGGEDDIELPEGWQVFPDLPAESVDTHYPASRNGIRVDINARQIPVACAEQYPKIAARVASEFKDRDVVPFGDLQLVPDDAQDDLAFLDADPRVILRLVATVRRVAPILFRCFGRELFLPADRFEE